MSELSELLDQVLIGGLRQGLKDAIDDCLAKGGDAAVIQEIIDRVAKDAPLTRHAAEAYLEQKLKERSGG